MPPRSRALRRAPGLVGAATAVLLTACPPVEEPVPPVGRSTVLPPRPDFATTRPLARPPDEVRPPRTVPAPEGVEFVTRTIDEPRRGLSARYPQVPGAEPLNLLLADVAESAVAGFLAEPPVGPARPVVPRLVVDTSFLVATDDLVGVRLVMTADSADGHRAEVTSYYYDRTTRGVSDGAALLAADVGTALADAVVADLRGQDVVPFDEAGTRAAVADGRPARATLAFTRGGWLLVRLPTGAATDEDHGPTTVSLGPAAQDGLLSELGRRVRRAVTRG